MRETQFRLQFVLQQTTWQEAEGSIEGVSCEISALLQEWVLVDAVLDCARGHCNSTFCRPSIPATCTLAAPATLFLGSSQFRGNATYEEVEQALCDNAESTLLNCGALLSEQSRKLPQTCAPGCTERLLANDKCDLECARNVMCNFDNLNCPCASGCPSALLRNSVCDLPCNISSCNYDQMQCLSSSQSTLNNIVAWIVGALCCFFFLYNSHSSLGIVSWTWYLRKYRRRMRTVENSYDLAHSRNGSEQTEQGIFMRASAAISEAPEATSLEAFAQLCPPLPFCATLSDFKESMCTICLGE